MSKPSQSEPSEPADADATEPDSDPQLTKTVSVATDADLTGGAVELPEPSAHALESAAAEVEEAQAQPSSGSDVSGPVKGKTDADGRAFDPAIHEGAGILNRDGFLKKKRGGARTRGTGTPSKVVPPSSGAPAQTAAPQQGPVSSDAAAIAATLVFLALSRVVGGDEFTPESGEPEGINSAFKNYFDAKGITDIPPGVALSITLGAFVLKRWNAPQFKEKRQGWWTGIKRWWHDWKYRKQMEAETEA